MHKRLVDKILIMSLGLIGLFLAGPNFARAYGGSYFSPVQDFQGPTALGQLNYNITTDASSSLSVAIGTGDTSSSDGSWTWVQLATSTNTGTVNLNSNLATLNGGSLLGKRYLQYRVDLAILGTGSELNATTSQPTLNNIDIGIVRGELYSNYFNSESLTNGLQNFAWNATIPTGSEIRFQFRSSMDKAVWTPWCGPDNGVVGPSNGSANCDSASIFVVNSASGLLDINSATPSLKLDRDLATSSDDIYFQYRAFFFPNPTNTANRPTLGTTSLGYVWDYFSGTYTSLALDLSAARPAHYSGLTFTASTTNSINWVEFRQRTGNSANTADGTWTAWQSGVSSSTNLSQGKFVVNFSTTSLEILDGTSTQHRFMQYEATLKTSDTNNFPVLHDVQVNTYTYNSGWFIGSWYNTQDPSAEMGSVTWLETSSTTDPHPYTVAVQARTASSSAGSPAFVDTLASDWFGPNGTTSTYFAANSATSTALGCQTNQINATTTSGYCPVMDGTVLSSGANDQFQQYKVYLYSDGWSAPTFRTITLGYGINVAPTFVNTTANSTTTGQAVRQWKEADRDKANTATTTLIMPNVDMTGKTLITFALSDADTNGKNVLGSSTARTPGHANLSLQYCALSNGICITPSDWSSAATSSFNIYSDLAGALVHDGLASNPSFTLSTTTVDIGDGSTTPAKHYRLLFDFKKEASLLGKYLPNFHYRVVADDSEGANRYGYLDSGTTTLDTLAPIVTRRIDASTQVGAKPATIYATTTDDTATTTSQLQYRQTLNNADWTSQPDLGWLPYTATSGLGLLADPATVYYQIKDEYGNIAVADVTSPVTPSNVMIADLSNVSAGILQLFLSWKQTTMPLGAMPTDFRRYVVWRATTTDLSPVEADLVFNRYAEIATSSQNFYFDSQGGMSSTTIYYYKVTAEDNGGSISRYMTGVTGIIHARPGSQAKTDITPPVIQGVNVIATTTQGATIVWNTDEPADSAVIFILETQALQNIASSADPFAGGLQVGLVSLADSPALLGQHIVTLSGLTPNLQYRFKVKSTDIAGNFSYIDKNASNLPLNFTTKRGPAISVVNVTSMTNTTATIVWHTDSLSDSLVSYASTTVTNGLGLKELQTPNIIKGAIDSTFDHVVKLFGLNPNTRYYFEVRSAETGNPTNLAIGRYITTSTDPEGPGIEKYFDFKTTYDQTPPTIGTISCQPSVSSVSGYSLFVVATTSEPSRMKIYYGSTSDPLNLETATSSDYNIDQSVQLSSLAASSTYYFRLMAIDESNNATTTATVFCNTIEPMLARTEHDKILAAALVGKVPEDEVGRRIASSSAIMINETVLSDPSDATSSNWIIVARQGWLSLTKATAWVLASTTQALLGTVPLAQKEQHTGTVYSQAELDAAKEAGKASAGGGGGMLIIDKTDKVAPVISDISISDITPVSAKVSWQTNEPASGFVRFGTSTEKLENNGFYGMFTDHWFILRNLDPGSKYSYQVASADASGNLSSSVQFVFETPRLATTSSPAMDYNIGSTTDANVSQADMQSAADKMMALLSNFSKVVSLNVLEKNLINQFDTIKKFAEMLPAPILSGEPTIETTPTTATISWLTDKNANSQVAFVPDALFVGSKRDSAYTQVVGQAQDSTLVHTVKIYNLKPDTSYHYQIRSKADLGPAASSRDFIFKSRPETLEIISHTTDIMSADKATFKWLTSAITDSEVKVIPYHGTTLAVDEAKTVADKSMTTNHSLAYQDFTAGLVYQITLSGKDAKGTKVEKVISSFSTTKDDLPPEISGIQTQSALSQSKDAKVQTIITWDTNEPTISQIKYAKGVFEGENDLTESGSIETVYAKKHTIVITKFAVGEVYSFRVLAIDSGGNQTLSGPHIILTPKQKEGVFELIIRTFESTFGWLGHMK